MCAEAMDHGCSLRSEDESLEKAVCDSGTGSTTADEDSTIGVASFDLRALVLERHGELACLEERYRVSSKDIGAGGYGRVHVAEDKEVAGRKVAAKYIHGTTLKKRRAFHNEVDLMSRLDHPNICRILEKHMDGHLLCIVMELCRGGDVFDRLSSRGRLPEDLAAEIVKQVAAALNYAHCQGIAHCDIKPENICFLSRDPADSHIKVIDWGAGYDFQSSAEFTCVTSKAYTAPEILERKGQHSRHPGSQITASDLWSLGVSMYVMLSGLPPFWGTSENQLQNMKNEQYPLDDKTWKAISGDAKDLLRGLLRAEPGNRLSMEKVLAHPWLRGRSPSGVEGLEVSVARQVLLDMQEFSKVAQIRSLFAVSVAQRLDHSSLEDIYQVFSGMDANGDGVLDLEEFSAGFQKVFGEGVDEVADVEAIFNRLDLNGSGSIDYSEFCGAGIGMHMASSQEETLWATFKDFDANDKIKQELWAAAATAQEESNLEAWFCQMRKESPKNRVISAEGVAAIVAEKNVAARQPQASKTNWLNRFCGFLVEHSGRPTAEAMLHSGMSPELSVATSPQQEWISM